MSVADRVPVFKAQSPDLPLSGKVSAPDALTSDEWARLMDHLRLCGRQSQVLRCAFYGETDSAIARRLQISEHTVHTYRARLFRTLHVTSTTQAIARVFLAYIALRNNQSMCEQRPGPESLGR